MSTADALTRGMGGRWPVYTQGSIHAFDLDAMTWERVPGPGSLTGGTSLDREPHRITRIERWPTVGGPFLLWIDDPCSPSARERWHRSSHIASIVAFPRPDQALRGATDDV